MKKGPRQIAALPVRVNQQIPQVMLITSRDTGRWIIPKGWPHKGLTPRAVAAREAYEEAGLRGRIQKRPVGSYEYEKRLTQQQGIVCQVTVFLLEVQQQLDEWPEQSDRQRCWLAPDEAAARVEEHELRELLLGIADRLKTGGGPKDIKATSHS